jgi:hypothetical protein
LRNVDLKKIKLKQILPTNVFHDGLALTQQHAVLVPREKKGNAYTVPHLGLLVLT